MTRVAWDAARAIADRKSHDADARQRVLRTQGKNQLGVMQSLSRIETIHDGHFRLRNL